MTERKYSSVAVEYTLDGNITNTVTTIALNSITGLPPAAPFTLFLGAGEPNEEIVTVSAIAGTASLTVVRGEDGSAAVSHTSGAKVRHGFSGRDMREPQQHIEATTGVHGLAPG